MRPGNNNNRRGRNRGQRKPHGGMPNKSQNFDSGGSETRVRGNVYQVLEKYLQLARDAGVAGDRVAAENFLQHADHYYRVIQTMNDGQRPRVGGREISVADVNVQNVSQGLSAALYSGGPSQPSMSDNAGNQAQPQGNGQGGNAANGQENGGEDGDGGDDQAEGGDYPQQGQGREGQGRESQNRDGNRDGQNRDGQNRDRNRQRREFRQNDRQNDRQGDRQNDRQNDRGNDRQNDRAAQYAERPAPVAAAPEASPAPQVSDEQPDYPEHLLPATTEAAPAEATPRAPREPRTPRPRLRARRPRAGEGEGDGAAEPAPATEE